MSKPRKPLYELNVAQLDCMASPVRAAIVRILAIQEEASIKELAASLGRSKTRLYHHVGALVEAGLLHGIERHASAGKKAETVYSLVSSRLSSAKAVGEQGGRAALANVARRFLNAAARRFAQAAADRDVRLDGPDRRVSIRQLQIKADDALIRELNDDLDALIEKYSPLAQRAGEPLSITLVVTPGA